LQPHPVTHSAKCYLLTTAAQLNRLLDETIGTLEWTARECKGYRHRLTAGELTVLWENVSRPVVRCSIARARFEEPSRTQDCEPADSLAGVYENIDEVAIGARVGPRDRRNTRAGIHSAEAVHGDVHRRRRWDLIKRNVQKPTIAAPVESIVDGQHV